MDNIKKLAKHCGMALLLSLFLALLISVVFGDLVDRLENVTYYFRYRLKFLDMDDEQKNQILQQNYGIHFVDIDDRSMNRLGMYWNWDRSYQAKMINTLSSHFPSAIIYDVLFSSPEDTTHRARLESILQRAAEFSPDIERSIKQLTYPLLTAVNYDSLMVDAIRQSARVYMGLLLSDESEYPQFALSQIADRMTLAWHDSLSPSSALYLPPDKRDRIIHSKDVIDGTYPDLAQNARDIGHIIVIPNDDGVIREIPLLYRYRDFDPVYLPVSLRAAITLFATPDEEINFVPSRYIDIGTPFKAFKDSSGALRFSYPGITPAQIRLLTKRSAEVLSISSGDRVDISCFVSAKRGDNGQISVELRSTGPLPAAVSEPLLAIDMDQLNSLEIGEQAALSDEVLIEREYEAEWMISYEDELWWVSSFDLMTLSKLVPEDFVGIQKGKRELVLHDFRVTRPGDSFVTTIPVLRAETVQQLCEGGWEQFQSMEPGSRKDFGEKVKVPLTKHNGHIVTFFGPSRVPFPYYSFYDIMENRVQGSLEGKIYIVGSSAPSLFDIQPVSHQRHYPAMEVHASLLNSFLTNTFIRRLSSFHDFLVLFLIGLVIGLVALSIKPVWGGVFSVLFAFSYLIFSITIFQTELLWIEVARPVLVILFTYTAVMVYRYMTEEKDRKFLQSTFKQYLSPELIDAMYKNKQSPRLGGDEGVRSAYFTDIEGFSTFSEKLGSPTRLVELLNEYLTVMTDILLDHFGTLDKYEGDAIIAFFGAPMEMPDHAVQACNAAIKMQQGLAQLREKWKSEGDKWPQIVKEMRMRIGINSGVITTGNMGSATRMNYTMMGDAVNLAARLESAAKQYGVYTMISEKTLEMTDNLFETRKLDMITVVGKSEPVVIYELIAQKGQLEGTYSQMLPLYAEGLELFYKREWKKAAELFSKSHELEPNRNFTKGGISPSLKFLALCEQYSINPPDENWNGVNKLTSK